MSADPRLKPPLDTERASRVLNFWAGGVHHYAPERELAKRIDARFPGTKAQVQAAREFHARACAWAVGEGIRGLIIGAAGYPAPLSPHEPAFAANPDVRAVYCAPDEEGCALNQGILATDPRIAACKASVRDPEGLLGCPEIRDLPRPWCLLVRMAAHWWPPDVAARIFADYGRLLPRGSVLAVSMFVPDGGPAGEELMAMLSEVAGPAYGHSAADLERWLDEAGFTLEPPGVRDVRAQGPEWGQFARRRGGRVVEAVARA